MAVNKRVANVWYQQVDRFEEACGLGSLRIETGSNNNWTSIPRGEARRVTPYNDPNDAFGGRFDWKCGSNLEHSECSDSPSGADFITTRDAGYPKLLKEIHDPPIGLYRKGRYDFPHPCIAIVGSRHG